MEIDIKELIRRLLSGEYDGLSTEGQPWTSGLMYKPTGGSGFGDGGDGQGMFDPNTPVGMQRVKRDGRNNYLEEYDLNGNLTDVRQWTDPSLMQEIGTAAALLGSVYGIGNGLQSMTNGGGFIDGVKNAFKFGGNDIGAPPVNDMGVGGSAFDAVGSTFNAANPFDLSKLGQSLGYDVLAPGAISGSPILAQGASLGGLGGIAASGGGFLDNLGNWISKPENILKTIGTVGSIAEGLKDTPDPNNFTQTTTKNLDPRISTAIFGADGNSGLFGDLMAFKNKYPTGQNQTMIDAQNGLRGLLTDPRVMNGYFTMGGTGLGLLNQGIAPNPWKPKG